MNEPARVMFRAVIRFRLSNVSSMSFPAASTVSTTSSVASCVYVM